MTLPVHCIRASSASNGPGFEASPILQLSQACSLAPTPLQHPSTSASASTKNASLSPGPRPAR
eukprot:14142209-Alexandrium_andersonii.AAC.1